MMRARIYIENKDWDSAIDDVQHVLKMNPADVEANKTLIRIFSRSGKLENAKESKNISFFNSFYKWAGMNIILML